MTRPGLATYLGDQKRGVMVESEAPTGVASGPRLARSTAHFREGRVFLLLALILIVAAAVRLVGIGQQSFSIDEIDELRVAHAGIADVATFGDGFPPLYHLILHFLVPLGDLAGRVLSALCGVATVGITWAWARRIAGIRVGLYAASLMALSPFAVQLSREGRAYSLMILLAAASLWSLWVALENPSTLRWVRWGLVSALGIYTHYLFAVVLAAWLIVALIELRGRPPRAMWVGIGTLGLLATPMLALFPGDTVVQLGLGSGAGIRLSEVVFSGYRLIAGFSLGPTIWEKHAVGMGYVIRAASIWIVLLTPVLGVLLVQGGQALDRIARRRLLALSLSGALLAGAAVQISAMGFVVHYVSWLVVPLAIWLAAGLVHLRSCWRWASATVLLVVAVSSVVARSLDPHHQVEDARGVAAYLESSGALDYPVFISGLTRARSVVYYIDRPRALALPDRWDPTTGRLGYYPDEQLGIIRIPPLELGGVGVADALELVDTHTERGQPYYLVYCPAFYGDQHGELLGTLSARDGLILVQGFAGMDVYRGVSAG